jgi:parallel beta-helix repeat protein
MALLCIAPMAWGYTTICYPDAADYNTGSTDGVTKTETSLIKTGGTEDGWFRFNVSAIPDTHTISSIRIHFYVDYAYVSGSPFNIFFNPLDNDPLTTGAAVLHEDITEENPYFYEDYGLFDLRDVVPGWYDEQLSSGAQGDLEYQLALDWFGVGWTTISQPYGHLDGWAETNVPYLVVSHTDHSGTSWYVDDDAPGDPGPGDPLVSDPLEDGSAGHPFDTLEEAIGAVPPGGLVLVEDGLYRGDRNRDIQYEGKPLTIRSINGPENCIIDCENATTGFSFRDVDGPDAVVEGLTIRNGLAGYGGAISCATESSPTIRGNILADNEADFHGGAIYCSVDSSPVIEGNLITGNMAGNNGGAIYSRESTALILDNEIRMNSCGFRGGAICGELASSLTIAGNIFGENDAAVGGGGVCIGNSTATLFNNLLYGNTAVGSGGGIYVFNSDLTVTGNTLAGNAALNGGGLGVQDATVIVSNSIHWGNTPSAIYVNSGADPSVSWSDVEGGYTGSGNIDADPLFVTGPEGDYCLSQVAAGQGADSPCVDVGFGQAANSCITLPGGDLCMDQLSTRTDQGYDSGQVDMGFHRPGILTVSATLGCWPVSGTLPLTSTMYVTMASGSNDQTRRVAGRIDVTLASGGFVSSWRAGFTNLSPGEVFSSYWAQQLPALPALVGTNSFRLQAEDVTPPPYNQPPYPQAGATGTAVCTIEGFAP